MDAVNKELKERAISLGLCSMWQKNWTGDKTPQELIDMYKKGIDFCFESGYPENEYIKRNFDKEILHSNNLYVDEEFYQSNPENDCVILDSQGKLVFDGYSVRDIYINGDSDVEIEVKDLARIFVNVYGNSRVSVSQRGGSTVHVYRHGDNRVLYTGSVVVRDSD